MIIPVHNSDKTRKKKVLLNRLSTLNEYDFSEPHRHEYFEFFCFLKGGGNHVVDFKEFPIKSNAIHVVGPGQVHQVNRALDSEGFVFLFELDALGAVPEINEFLFRHVCYDVNERSPIYALKDADYVQMKMITDNCWHQKDNGSAIKELFFQNAVQSLVLLCMNTEETFDPTDTMYSSFRKLLFQEFRSLKKVKDYAHALNVTEKSLNEVVKKATGASTSQLIYKQIILEAKRLLLTGISAKEAAYNLNFDDPAHFSKFFKSNTGYSPSEFKKIHD